MRTRFDGQFEALTKQVGYCNSQRFTPLRNAGKPLWEEFKEHDHRLYCCRDVIPPNFIVIVLLSGWVKQKEGKTEREFREIQRAMELYNEFLSEGGNA